MAGDSRLYIDVLYDHDDRPLGYAVVCYDGEFKVGPNPITKRAAEYVLRIFHVLAINTHSPQPRGANGQIQDTKLRKWLMNQI